MFLIHKSAFTKTFQIFELKILLNFIFSSRKMSQFISLYRRKEHVCLKGNLTEFSHFIDDKRTGQKSRMEYFDREVS